MTADAKKGESEAQAAYEQTVADSNNGVDALNKEVTTKGKDKVKAKKDLEQTEQDIMDTLKELEGLSKENANLHKEWITSSKTLTCARKLAARRLSPCSRPSRFLMV